MQGMFVTSAMFDPSGFRFSPAEEEVVTALNKSVLDQALTMAQVLPAFAQQRMWFNGWSPFRLEGGGRAELWVMTLAMPLFYCVAPAPASFGSGDIAGYSGCNRQIQGPLLASAPPVHTQAMAGPKS